MRSSEDAGKKTTLLAFGHVLKRLRLAADLTQQELAERAMLSARLISDLERGTIHRPRRDSAEMLADGLRLQGPDRDAFIALARGRPPVAAPDAVVDATPGRRLPHPPTSIVGRLKETAAATALVLDPDVHLLTLTGPGGVGKTRLALEVASRVVDAVPDGVIFVDLSPLRDPELVLTAIVQALGLRSTPGLSPRQAVMDALRDRHMLLVLDNFEHLAAAGSLVADLLAACPALTVLSTSRTPLRIRAEQEYPVGPLALPDRRAIPSLDELAQTPAIELFVRRAEAANRAFALTSGNASDVAEIAQRLDGLPLAIELAATRVKVLSPAALLARLDRRLPFLTGGAQDLPARQQTLRATLEWSHDLLTAEEQALFRRLAVFVGGFSLEAAEDVGGKGEEGGRSAPGGGAHEEREGSAAPGTVSSFPLSPFSPSSPLSAATPLERSDPPPSVLDLVASLVDQSLLRVQEDLNDEQRFGMLETIREFGQERLAAAGEEEDVRDRHLLWCVHLAERAAPEIDAADQLRWVRRLEIEHDNLRVALGWALDRRNGELAQRLGGALPRFWVRRGHIAEGRRWLEQALLLEENVPPAVRANALVGLARLAYHQADYEVGPTLEAALALFREAGDNSGAANALATLGMVFADLGDYDRALALEEEALAIYRMLGDQTGVVRLVLNIGLDAYDQGDYDRAATQLEEALSLGRSVGSWYSVGYALNNLALVALERQDYERAEMLQAEALDLWQGLGNRVGIADCFENFAMFSVAQNAFVRAARLFGAAQALRALTGVPGRPVDRESLARYITATRAELGEAPCAAAWDEGAAMSTDEAIAYAVGED